MIDQMNPYAIAQRQIDIVAKYLDLDEGILEKLEQTRREAKSLGLGGSLGRYEATGKDVFITAQEAANHLGLSIEGANRPTTPGADETLFERGVFAVPDILANAGGVKETVEAIKLGAEGFLEKLFSREGLRAWIAQILQIWELREENRDLKAKMEFEFGLDSLVGNSTTILKRKQMIAQVGHTDASILIQGEADTGKELVAPAIHYHSPRSDNNLVPVDCAAISETVMESEK